jgi:exodeoxyribonuclease V beta subunit
MTTSQDFDVFSCPLDGIRLLEASAGTGKTWNICGLYLRLLLEQALDVKQILVVTFTNAATAELRTRVRNRIVELLAYLNAAGGQGKDEFPAKLIAAIEDREGPTRDVMLLRLRAALGAFDEAAIFTIHGYCQRALADAPFASGHPFALELVEDDGDVRREAVQDFWRRYVATEHVSSVLAGWLVENKDSPEKWAALLGRCLAKPLSRVIWPEEGDLSGEQRLLVLSKQFASAFEIAREQWVHGAFEATQLLLKALLGLKGTHYKAETIQKSAEAWTLYLACGDPMRACFDLPRDLGLFATATMVKRAKLKAKNPPTHPFYDAADTLLALHNQIVTDLTLARLRLLRRLLETAVPAVRQKKRDRRRIAYDDILYNAYDALTSGRFPWLAATLRDRYPAALIDEFQDTDPLQFAIFDRIYRTADEEDGAGCMFLVGDPKQAIYSFRNADLHTYLRAKRSVDGFWTLRRNQRSVEGLITSCNHLFARNPNAFVIPDLQSTPVTPGAKRRDVLVDTSEPGDAVGPLRIWRLPQAQHGQYLLREDAFARAASATAAEIARLINAGREKRITIANADLRPAHIAVLVKSHVHGARMKVALAALGVGSVELSQASIFLTADAEELLRVLRAIIEPTRHRLLLGALATELMGYDAGAVARLVTDDPALLRLLMRFADYRDQWLRRGFSVMIRGWMEAEGVTRLLLARPDGERRLTNLLHLVELLQEASVLHPAPDALVHWLATQRSDKTSDDVAQLRLESDQNLVQIVTVHKAKGLEYDIVFCPFLWDGFPTKSAPGEGREYHDDDDLPVIDLRPEAARDLIVAERMKVERHAEFLRLLYVALTRAVQRCYLVVGCYARKTSGSPSMKEGNRSLLNWLVAGGDMSHDAWLDNDLSPADIERAWAQLAEDAAPHLSLIDLPATPGTVVVTDPFPAETLRSLSPPQRIPVGWRIGSFSSLQAGAERESAASDHDAYARNTAVAFAPAQIDADDILLFPRGPSAGDCIHAVFERIDFTHSAAWGGHIVAALTAHPQRASDPVSGADSLHLNRMLRSMLESVLETTLPEGIVLGRVPTQRRLVEFSFHLPAAHLSAVTLNAWFVRHNVPNMKLAFGALSGYLTGYIDLVFAHGERFYLADWKSNHLGFTPRDYALDRLEEAMFVHGYHFQSLLYCVALHRYLRRRVAGYDYERHFGGVLYLFVRGLRPAWQVDGAPAGIYFRRPDRAMIDSLDALLAGANEALAS